MLTTGLDGQRLLLQLVSYFLLQRNNVYTTPHLCSIAKGKNQVSKIMESWKEDVAAFSALYNFQI